MPGRPGSRRSDPNLLERQLATLDLAIQPDNVMAEAGCNGLRGRLARRHRCERRIELRSRVARRELAQIAADSFRGACRMCRANSANRSGASRNAAVSASASARAAEYATMYGTAAIRMCAAS